MAIVDGADYLSAARGVVRLRGREFRFEFDGDPAGGRGPVDEPRLEVLGESTGQARAIGRLVEATKRLDPA